MSKHVKGTMVETTLPPYVYKSESKAVLLQRQDMLWRSME